MREGVVAVAVQVSRTNLGSKEISGLLVALL